MTTVKKTTARPRAKASKGPGEIAPGVFVGSWKEAEAFEGERFCVLDEAPPDMPKATHIKIYDEPTDAADAKSLDRLASAMKAAHERGAPVIVFCGMGKYRSPLGAAWYLHRTEGLTLDAAYARVVAVRPGAKPASEWLGNLAEIARA